MQISHKQKLSKERINNTYGTRKPINNIKKKLSTSAQLAE
jgi:hypothetical protein